MQDLSTSAISRLHAPPYEVTLQTGCHPTCCLRPLLFLTLYLRPLMAKLTAGRFLPLLRRISGWPLQPYHPARVLNRQLLMHGGRCSESKLLGWMIIFLHWEEARYNFRA